MTMMNCHEAAVEYATMGFSVIPVSRDKKPLIKWAEFQKRIATHDELSSWRQRWPEANVAIVTGSVSGIAVVDADGKEGERWIADNAPKTSVYSRTRKGVHAFYRIPNGALVPNRARLAPEVDIRGEGGYVVVPPSIHESGHLYEWIFIGGGWKELVEWEPTSRTNGNGNLNVNLSGVQSQALFDKPVGKGQRNQTLSSLIGVWINEGVPLNGAIERARAWSDSYCKPPLGLNEIERTVQSVYATCARKNSLPRYAINDIYIPSPVESDPVPESILRPGGILQEIMDYVRDSSSVSFEYFSLGAAICAVGTLVGQKVITETGLRTNMYIIALADSGTGKNAPLNAIPSLFIQSGADDYLGLNEFSSDSAIVSRLARHPRQLFLLDEIGDFLREFKNPYNRHMGSVIKELKTLFSGTERPHKKGYAKEEDDRIIAWHHLSFYATGVPGRFWDQLTHNDVTDGFIARCLVLESDHEPVKKRRVHNKDIPASLVEKLSALYRITPPPMKGEDIFRPAPFVIGKTTGAETMFNAWAERWDELHIIYRKEPDGRAAIYNRAAEHASKLALIHAVSQHGNALINGGMVDVENVRWAMEFIEHAISNMVRQIENNVSANEMDSWLLKLKKAIGELSAKHSRPITQRELAKQVRGLIDRPFDSLINWLVRNGEIGIEKHKPARGRETVRYFLVKDDENV